MRRKYLPFLLIMALLLPLIVVAPIAADSGTRWTAEFFDNRNLSGNPRHVRLDNAISFDWGTKSPIPGLIPEDNFSIRWTGVQDFSGGDYTFSATSDDGVRVWVDNQLVIDAWYDQIPTTHYGNISLTPGQHWVRVEYYDAVDNASIYVSWRAGNTGSSGSWAAEYYNNIKVEAPQVAGRLEPSIDHDWGGGSPFPGIVNNDNFSARWWSFPVLDAGIYEFVAGADDGVRVWVAGTKVIDAWEHSTYREHRGTLEVVPGPVTIQVEYFEGGDQARVNFYWQYLGPGAGPEPAPPEVAPPPTVTAMVTAFRLNVRSGPGTQHNVITKINQGETYPVIGRSEDGLWLQISGPGYTGWSATAYMEVNEDPNKVPVADAGQSVPSGVLLAQSHASLRIRRGPGTNQARIGALQSGESAQVVGRTADSSWLQVRKDDGLEGWISNSGYISLVGDMPLANIPVTS